MQAEIIFTGNELLTGQVSNTYGGYLGERLTEIGISVILQTTVGDNRGLLKQALDSALKRSDLVITTGGLGPTDDDITKETIAELLSEKLVVSEAVLRDIHDSFTGRGLNVPRSVHKQAMIPENAVTFKNTKGTAPGLLIEKGRTVILLPGPPVEMKYIFEHSVIPYLKEKKGCKPNSKSKIFKITGIAEAFVQDRIREIENTLGNSEITYLVNPGEVQLKILIRGSDTQGLKKRMEQAEEKVRRLFDNYIFEVDDEFLEELVGNLLVEKGMTIGLAESCTGGLIGSVLTSVPGSSRFFLGGIISYTNDIKEKVLGVPKDVLDKQGAVSEESACFMAKGARKVLMSDIGLAVTGIAGPGGGTLEKPVGLVYVALFDGKKITCHRFVLPGARKAVRKGALNASLNMVRQYFADI